MELVHHVGQVHWHTGTLGCDGNVAILVDGEVLEAPASDIVELGAILDAPLVDC
jgi:hypothetical protein